MKTIKIAEGTRVIVDGEAFDFFEGTGFAEACECINIPEEYRNDLFRVFFAQGYLDLSEAYEGHTVRMELIPVTEGADEWAD